jgi:hypothetical protein
LVSFNNPSTFVSTSTVSGSTRLNNVTTINLSLNVSGFTTLNNGLTVVGRVNFHNGASGGVLSIGIIPSGPLTIGEKNANYGGKFYTGGVWSGTNTAGLLFEFLNNTEFVVHDNDDRLTSLMYFEI